MKFPPASASVCARVAENRVGALRCCGGVHMYLRLHLRGRLRRRQSALTKPISVLFSFSSTHRPVCVSVSRVPCERADGRGGGGRREGEMEAALSAGQASESGRLSARQGQLRRVVDVVGCAARVPWLGTYDGHEKT